MTLPEVETHFTDHQDFEAMATAVFVHQLQANDVYRRYCESLGIVAWKGWREVPYLPVAAFKHVAVASFPPEEAEAVFLSSGTGSASSGRHHVKHLAVYARSVRTHFRRVFGPGPFTIMAHLPQYAASGSHSSLVKMLDFLIESSGDGASGFFLDDRQRLDRAMAHSLRHDTRLVLFGAAFGLLDLIEQQAIRLPPDAIVIETGGMKTHRRERTRAELHAELMEGLGVAREQLWSEYGMCELLSQCYAPSVQPFTCPAWMRFKVVDPDDPLREVPDGAAGALALFDIANMHSVSAILTEDRVVSRGNGFEVLGRLSGAELRGCNFLLERV